ncbi:MULTISPECIES: hypothetical protein [unclassified Moorena]|nr:MULTISPECIES: hypothetical protein [unclassified Moorena]
MTYGQSRSVAYGQSHYLPNNRYSFPSGSIRLPTPDSLFNTSDN